MVSGKYLAVSFLLIVMMTTNVSASYLFYQNDSTTYSDGRIDSPYACFTGEEADKNDGYMQAAGDHNWPFPFEYCKLEIVMRFRPTENGRITVGSDWTISYLIETNFPVGDANLYVKYVLYTDGYNALESKTVLTVSCSTPLWGGYNSRSGIVTKSGEDSVNFVYSLQANTWYRMAVQAYITLNGEANAWSSAGYPDALYLDVAEIAVWR